MKILLTLALAAIPWGVILGLFAAANGAIGWAFAAAALVVLALFVAGREYDAIQSDRDLCEATRHPRL